MLDSGDRMFDTEEQKDRKRERCRKRRRFMPIKIDKIHDTYDVVVIGGGIGGLTAANRMAKFGRSVLLVEQHFEFGGLAAYFRRGQNIFDTALHGFPVGMIKTCRKYWSKEMADCIVPLESIRYANPQFHLDTTFTIEDFCDKLEQQFGIDRETIDRFFKRTGTMDFFDDQKQTNRELFEEFFPGRTDVVRFLMEPITYANGSTLDEPAISYGIVFSNFMSKGVYFFEGGTDRFIRMCEAILEENGAHLVTGARAEKIVLENGSVAGVVVNGKRIGARAVISNANLKQTVMDMIGEDDLPADFAESTRSTRLSTSNCQVYIGIKEGVELPFVGDIIFHSSAEEYSPAVCIDYPPESRSLSVYYPKSRPPNGRCAVVASMGANYREWSEMSAGDYAAAKQGLVEQTLGILENEYFADIRQIADLDHIETATPLTFERYTLHSEGATFGTKFEGLKVSENLPKVVPGMYHTGSTAIIMSGWLGAANYGVIVANQADEYLDKL